MSLLILFDLVSNMGAPKVTVKKSREPPICYLFRNFKSGTLVSVWLTNEQNIRIEGVIDGFDEYMNFVMKQAEEVNIKTSTRRPLGRLMLKGENIALVSQLDTPASGP